MADERSNLLIVISEPANFTFFDRIVEALDTPVEPEVTVKVRPLEYADATEVAGILNEFIGAAAAERTAAPGGADLARSEDRASRDLLDFVRQRAQQRETALETEAKAKIGQLSRDTKILADKRTNSLLLMGRRGDLAVLEEVLGQLDIMLGQVLIEAVILEIGLNDRIESGISWLQRSIGLYNEEVRGPGGGVTVRQPVGAFGGAWASNAGNQFIDGAQVTRSGTYERGALSYFLSFYDFNVDAIIRMVASSGDARVLSTPVVMTTDNTEAKIIAGEERPIVTATTTDTGTANRTSSYQYKPIGIELTVTPRINPQRLVVMDIVQTADNVVDTVKIDGNDVPIITKREISATIAIQDRETLVLGGLVRSGARKGRSKIPILGDLPILGALFRADDREATRTELLVLITPYVLMTPAEARRETARVHAASSAGGTTWPEGWSDSPLATLTPEQLRARERDAKEKTTDEAPRARPEPAAPATQPEAPAEWPEDVPADAPASRLDPHAPVGRRAPIN